MAPAAAQLSLLHFQPAPVHVAAQLRVGDLSPHHLCMSFHVSRHVTLCHLASITTRYRIPGLSLMSILQWCHRRLFFHQTTHSGRPRLTACFPSISKLYVTRKTLSVRNKFFHFFIELSNYTFSLPDQYCQRCCSKLHSALLWWLVYFLAVFYSSATIYYTTHLKIN